MPHHCGSRPHRRKRGLISKRALHHQRRHLLRLWEIIIMSRYCEEMRRIIKRLTGQDNHDHHHRRKGEEDREGIRHQEQEPNDIDKKTRPTTSTMTSSIKNHILDCAISHGSRASSTCLCGIDDIASSILDYLDSSRSSNGQHQSINIKQQRQTENINIKQDSSSNINDLQNLHIKVPQQEYIKPMIGDYFIDIHNISLNHAMPDFIDNDSTSSGLITLDEANIMSTDIKHACSISTSSTNSNTI